MNTFQARFRMPNNSMVTVTGKAEHVTEMYEHTKKLFTEEVWKNLHMTSLKQVITERNSIELSTSQKKARS